MTHTRLRVRPKVTLTWSRLKTYPANHDTQMHNVEHIIEDAKDVMMGDTVGDDSEVIYLTPSKVVQRSPPKKMRVGRLKSPFVITIETREQLKNTLPDPDMFDPTRPNSEDMVMNFFEYMADNEENALDYRVHEVDKSFFNVLLTEASWLTDKVKITFFFLLIIRYFSSFFF